MNRREMPIPSPEDIAFGRKGLVHVESEDMPGYVEENINQRMDRMPDSRAKLELALLLTGEKPAAIFNFEHGTREILDSLSIPNQVVHSQFAGPQIFAGKDQEAFQILMEAEKIEDRKLHSEAQGRALGYPETAIQAFLRDEQLKTDLPKELKTSRLYTFINFTPSQSHWREELTEFRGKIEAVRELTPEIYNDITSDEKNKR